MLMLLSPSKTLDYDRVLPAHTPTRPEFRDESFELVEVMKKHSVSDIKNLMKLSDNLAELNHARYQGFESLFTTENSRAALFAFKGDVYDNMDSVNYTPSQLDFAQKHLRILSGLYGMLRPLDLMQPYRLEMGTKLKNEKGENLYDFWKDTLTEKLNQEIMSLEGGFVLNLASGEYFKAIDVKKLRRPLINVHFKHIKNGEMKTIGLMAKRARGAFADWVIKSGIKREGALSSFKEQGYVFMPDLSDDTNLTFILDMDA
ncbi:MAG: peroxide stress protein YaaA [Alphaproteobacteria bacterium]|nr:peroxide stress protein YaaA [Alphaproteobacteria bacterium]